MGVRVSQSPPMRCRSASGKSASLDNSSASRQNRLAYFWRMTPSRNPKKHAFVSHTGLRRAVAPFAVCKHVSACNLTLEPKVQIHTVAGHYTRETK